MSRSGYLHWSYDPFEKMVIFRPDPLLYYQMPYGDGVRGGGGCVPLYLNGPKLDLSYFVRGVGVRCIVAQGAGLLSINMLKHYLKHPT